MLFLIFSMSSYIVSGERAPRIALSSFQSSGTGLHPSINEERRVLSSFNSYLVSGSSTFFLIFLIVSIIYRRNVNPSLSMYNLALSEIAGVVSGLMIGGVFIRRSRSSCASCVLPYGLGWSISCRSGGNFIKPMGQSSADRRFTIFHALSSTVPI